MAHEDPALRHEIHRAKQLAARFARLEREIANLEPIPAIESPIELDTATRDAADEWLSDHFDANARPTTDYHHAPNNSLRG